MMQHIEEEVRYVYQGSGPPLWTTTVAALSDKRDYWKSGRIFQRTFGATPPMLGIGCSGCGGKSFMRRSWDETDGVHPARPSNGLDLG